MEDIASAEAATIKKKRNRSQKKPKTKPDNNAEQSTKPGNAGEVPVGIENNGKLQHETANPASKQEVSEAGQQLTRKPSRRRNRKPKTGAHAHDTKEDAAVLESDTICGGQPQQQPPSTVDLKPSCVGKKPSAVDRKTTARAADSGKPPIATDFKTIALDDIFPGPHVFSFSDNNFLFGKLTPVSPVADEQQQKSHTGACFLAQGLLNITCEDIFPSNPSIGSQRTEAAVIEPVQRGVDNTEQNVSTMSAPPAGEPKTDKTREEILAEREAKKAAKLAAKNKSKDKASAVPGQQPVEKPNTAQKKEYPVPAELSKSGTDVSICEKMKDLHISDAAAAAQAATAAPPPAATAAAAVAKELSKAERKAQFETKNPALVKKGADAAAKPALSKAERRAIQEAQRAAKAEAQQAKKSGPTDAATKQALPSKGAAPAGTKGAVQKSQTTKKSAVSAATVGGSPRKHIVTLFNHLYQPKFAAAETVNSPTLHPAVVKLGIQYAEGSVVGSKARCLALLKMLNLLIHDYETPPEKEFGRSFEETLNTSASYLQRCRPFSVSMTNALRHVKMYTRQLDGKVSVSEQKECLLESIESYIRDHIEKAEEAICITVQEKIYDGDVILTYGCSSLIKHILEEANRRSKNFRVVIVNARPREEEHAMLEALVQQGVKCTCVLINAVSYVMPEVTKVLLGAHALLANGSVMSRVGTAQIALVAKSYNVPVLVCCETHKFTERVQTDAFVYNEIGNPNDLVLPPRTRDRAETKPMLADWETLTSLTILNLHYDVTPPELVTAVVTEVAILPCTSVPVILRIKPSDVTY